MNLETGDLLLCDSKGKGFFYFFDSIIKHFTHSNYTHIAMIIKDPSFIHPSLKGLYVWESGWENKPDPQDNKIKLGVQITPYKEFYDSYINNEGSIYLRKILCTHEKRAQLFNNDKLKTIHQIVYDKPYDIVPKDWIDAYLKKDSNPQKTNRFWCSALIGYIYSQLGIIDNKIDWSILAPVDFSSTSKTLKFSIDLTCDTKI